MPQPPDEPLLRPVWPKRHDLGVFGVVTVALDHNFVECSAEKPPFRVRKTPRQLCRVLRELSQRLVVRDRGHGSVVVQIVAGLGQLGDQRQVVAATGVARGFHAQLAR